MRLLVSVRSAAEVGEALAGGADIIDAKEPARGGLGAVEPDVLRAIVDRVPAGVPMSVALGDFTDRAHVLEQVARLPVGRPGNTVFLKLGFAGLSDETRLAGLIGAAVGAAGGKDRSHPSSRWAMPTGRVRGHRRRRGSSGRRSTAARRESCSIPPGRTGAPSFDWMSAAAVGRWIAERAGPGCWRRWRALSTTPLFRRSAGSSPILSGCAGRPVREAGSAP